MKADPKDKFNSLFSKELKRIENWEAFFATDESLDVDKLREVVAEILSCYKKLLKDSLKITSMGDSAQRKLIKAQEEITILNERLQDSEQNIKELNGILLEYIKATGR